jgi:protein phosphatase
MGLISWWRRTRPDPEDSVSDEPVIRRNEGISLQAGGMELTVGQAQHLGMRRQQQDAFALSEASATPFVAALADGMGGMRNGAEASRTALREFLAAMAAGETPADALRIANTAVYQIGVDAGEAESTGTTLAAVLLADARMGWISVGDSQIYLSRGGELSTINAEHSYLLDLYQDVIRGELDLATARLDPQKDALTSFVGLESLTRIDQSPPRFPMLEGDRIMICSDGLYRALSEAEILAVLSSDSANPADDLVKQAMAKNFPHQDNTTVITLSIDRIL